MQRTILHNLFLRFMLILFLALLVGTLLHLIALRRERLSLHIEAAQQLASVIAREVERLPVDTDTTAVSRLTPLCRQLVQSTPFVDYCVVTDSSGKMLAWSYPNGEPNSIHFVPPPQTGDRDQNVFLLGKRNRFYDTLQTVERGKAGSLLIHAGFAEEKFVSVLRPHIAQAAGILALILILSSLFILRTVQRHIENQVASLLVAAQGLAAGALDSRVGDLKGREFGQLAASMNVIGESMQRRQEDLRNNFRALEEAHGYLSDSYQRLEHLSGELERSEGLYRSLLKFSGDAIVVMDHSGEIRMANIRAEQLFGYPASRLIGLTYERLRQLLHMTGEGGEEFFTEVLHAGSGECDVEFLTGERGTAARLFGTLITSGDERLIQVIIHETTREREVLQNLERNASELARLNKMKDSFLGLASHELKTPLTVIMGYAELITTSMADSVNPSVLSMVENISNAANRLDSIVRDMVDVSMIEEKKLQLKQEEMDMNELIRATERELSFFFTLRKQRLHLELDETIPLIRGDSVRIMQLLANIVGNAIKFTPDGGTITVSTRLTYTPDNRRRSLLTAAGLHKLFVETIVSDTGIGIDTEDHLRIFDKFYEVGNIDEHSSGKVAFKGKGVGLGLAIAKGIVDMHGGLIWVESTGYDPDLFPGSTFHILLPVTTLVSDVTIDYLASVTAGDEKRTL